MKTRKLDTTETPVPDFVRLKAGDLASNMKMPSALVEVLQVLRRKRSEWEFVQLETSSLVPHTAYIKSVSVLCGGEEIGRIGVYRNPPSLSVVGTIMGEVATEEVRTGVPVVAARTALRVLRLPTESEILRVQRNHIARSEKRTVSQSILQNAVRRRINKVAAILYSHKEQIMPRLSDGEAEALERLMMAGQIDEKGGVMVSMFRGKVYVAEPDGTEICSDDADGASLPHFLRQRLGKLKLCNAEQYVADVGYKALDGLYMVMVSLEEQQQLMHIGTPHE